MTQDEIGTIMRAIGNLEGKVDIGFNGIHNRQDIANGRTAKNESRIMALEKTNNEKIGESRIRSNQAAIVWSLISSSVAGIMVSILVYFKILK